MIRKRKQIGKNGEKESSKEGKEIEKQRHT
jgi:hypothetical protein